MSRYFKFQRQNAIVGRGNAGGLGAGRAGGEAREVRCTAEQVQGITDAHDCTSARLHLCWANGLKGD